MNPSLPSALPPPLPFPKLPPLAIFINHMFMFPIFCDPASLLEYFPKSPDKIDTFSFCFPSPKIISCRGENLLLCLPPPSHLLVMYENVFSVLRMETILISVDGYLFPPFLVWCFTRCRDCPCPFLSTLPDPFKFRPSRTMGLFVLWSENYLYVVTPCPLSVRVLSLALF